MILNSGNRILKISTHFGISTLISERSFHSSFCLRMNEKKTTFADNNRKVESILNKGKIKIFEIMSIYEEAIGLKEIKDAQNQVLESEKKFIDAQQERRALNIQITEIQQKLRNFREEMDRLSRTESRYLQLFTDEHNTLKNELRLINDYKLKENEERELFFYLSAALRNSQEKERARVERTKYLQLGMSVLCTGLGILSAYLVNYFKNSSIREILDYDKEQFQHVSSLVNTVLSKQANLESNLGQNLEALGKQFEISVLNMSKEQYQTTYPAVTNAQDIPISMQFEGEYFYLKPYVLSALFLFGFILFMNNK